MSKSCYSLSKIGSISAFLGAATAASAENGLGLRQLCRHMWLSCGSSKPYGANILPEPYELYITSHTPLNILIPLPHYTTYC